MAGEARRIDEDGTEPERAAAGPVRVPRQLHDATQEFTPRDDVADGTPLDDVSDTARALGLCVAEVLSGARDVDSIARWITDDVHRHLQQRAVIAARARSASRRSPGRALLRVGSVIVCRPADGVAETAVVVHTRSHARAVAMRLEERQGRWRATAVGVL